MRGEITSEKDVKREVKKLLDRHGWFWWMPPGNGYGASGVSDFNAIKDGVFLVVETKFGKRKPTPMQKAFAESVLSQMGIAMCVNEDKLPWLAAWLESFELSVLATRKGEKVDDNHGARMVNAQRELLELYQ